jgi:hypothetical protein
VEEEAMLTKNLARAREMSSRLDSLQFLRELFILILFLFFDLTKVFSSDAEVLFEASDRK